MSMKDVRELKGDGPRWSELVDGGCMRDVSRESPEQL